MHHTLFDTPVVNTVLRAGSLVLLRINGWTVEGSLPPEATKSVLIAAPTWPRSNVSTRPSRAGGRTGAGPTDPALLFQLAVAFLRFRVFV